MSKKILIIIVFLAFLAGGVFALFQKSIPEGMYPYDPNASGTGEVVIKNLSQISRDGTVTLSAIKTQATVEVKVSKNGNIIKSFTYNEPFSADNTGNTWTGLLPSIALSPDGAKIAYSDTKALVVLDLSMGVRRSIRAHLSSRRQDEIGDKFVNPIWFPDSRRFLYFQTAYEGMSLGAADATTGEYNDSVLLLSPSMIEVVEVKGRTYIIYFTSQSNDTYGGIPGLFVAEVFSIQEIKFTNLFDFIGQDIDVTSAKYDDAKKHLVFEFYRDYYSERKTKHRGTIFLDGSNFSEHEIPN